MPKVNEIIEKYITALVIWKKENYTIQHASDSLWDLARVEAMKSNHTNTWDSAWNYAWKEASQSTRNHSGGMVVSFLPVGL